jgi:SAP domain-containing new25/Domain of unknown function (DUF6434)
MPRPALETTIAVEEFRRWYWLKAELAALCKVIQVTTVGTKPDLTARIDAYLSGKPAVVVQQSRRVGTMPSSFTPETVIGEGWRCNPALGAFFKDVCGKSFRFNAAVRQAIHEGKGKTLSEAIAIYQQSTLPNLPKQPIIAQNQYNQHTRDFFARHKNATREQCIAEWRRKREQGAV